MYSIKTLKPRARHSVAALFLFISVIIAAFQTALAAEQLQNVKLDIAGAKTNGTATITNTPFDIGTIDNVFDGDVNTLARTPNINPAFVQIAFNSSRILSKFRVHCSYGDNYDWVVEKADTQSDMDSKTGTYAVIVPARNFTSGTWDEYTLPSAVTAKLFRITVQRYGYDGYCHIDEIELYGTVTVDTLSVSPTSGSLVVGNTMQFTCKGRNISLNEYYEMTNLASWYTTGGVGTVSVGLFTATAMGSGTVYARYGSMTSNSASLTITQPNVFPDINVLYIERTPRIAFVSSNTQYATGLPAAGQLMTYKAYVKNWGQTSVNVPYQWYFDGVPSGSGTVTIGAGQTTTLNYTWNWETADHTLEFVADPDFTLDELSKVNNRALIRTNALLVGVWVEQSLYDYFHENQWKLNTGSNGFEDWAQYMVKRWNDMLEQAVYPNTPNGGLDRVSLDKVVVVADNALPLNGGIESNNPDSSDKTVDMMWGYPYNESDISSSGFYGFKWNGPFLIDYGSIHEMCHARFIIDGYGFDTHQSGDPLPIQITDDGGNLVAKTSLMPAIAWDAVYYNKYSDLMGGGNIFNAYVAGSYNWKAKKRGRGNMNAPPDIGVFLQNLPNSNHIQFIDQQGKPIVGAAVDVYRATSGTGWYAKTFDNTVDLTYTTDSTGSIHMPRNPFSSSSITHTYGLANGVVIMKMRHNGQLYFLFQEATDFNIQYWMGNTANAYYIRQVDLRDNPSTVPNNAWLGNYFNGTSYNTHIISRTDTALNFDWGAGSPATGVTSDNFTVFWHGKFTFTEGFKKFNITSDGGFQLYIDGQCVFDKWDNTALQTWTPTIYTYKTAYVVTPGQSSMNGDYHRLQVRYKHNTGNAKVAISWTDADYPQHVPYGYWRADYYSTKTLNGYLLSRYEEKIDNNYGSGSPEPQVPTDNFSARWTGDFTFMPGTYRFTAVTNDGMRVYVDGVLVLDKWFDQNTTTYTFDRTLTYGIHRVEVLYYGASGDAVAKLSWAQQNWTYHGSVGLGDWLSSSNGVVLQMTVGAQTFNITLDSDGKFLIPVSILDGTYSVKISGRSWLRQTLNNVVFPLKAPLSFSLTNGDVNADNKVDDADIVRVAGDLGAMQSGLFGYTDTNGSGWCTEDDLWIVLTHLKMVGDN